MGSISIAASRGWRWRAAAGVASGLLVAGSLVAAIKVDSALDLRPGPNEYNVAAWEVRNIPGKWLFLLGQVFRGEPSDSEQDETLRRFFELNAEIQSLEEEVSDDAQRGAAAGGDSQARLSALRDERDQIESQVEATLESRIAEVLGEQGITRDLFVDEVVWPPVDAEFTEAPRSLATSPRDRIELLSSTLLREDLSLEEAERIEEETAREQDVAALSFSTAGIGAYPTIIDYPATYRRALDVVAHEWMHNYLFFRPLGFDYYGDNDLRTMNETTADLVAREIAGIVAERWPLEPAAAEVAPPAAEAEQEEGVDLGAELRRLRGEVDALLADGKVEEAERLMEQRRQELAAQGFFIRKINQAYFAYLNLYAGEAGSAAATNPIGPKIDELRRLSPSLRGFVDVMGGVTSVAELDAALEQAKGQP